MGLFEHYRHDARWTKIRQLQHTIASWRNRALADADADAAAAGWEPWRHHVPPAAGTVVGIASMGAYRQGLVLRAYRTRCDVGFVAASRHVQRVSMRELLVKTGGGR